MSLRPRTAEALSVSLRHFTTWLSRANPSERYTYHIGLLAADRWEPTYDGAGTLTWIPVEPFDTLATVVWEAHRQGLVRLFQHRVGPAHYEYIAERTRLA